ncbi:MAG: hypothetical protein JSS96_02355 [Bacteroidetes bacterium]|nr:hypothetical protein [Bacteroidota bacterium]
MDVAKYIGLFILKNHFCYIQGLGNLEMKKRPASYDGRALHAASYDILLVPAGSLDDSLANFIATNEQISISKAANALREYSLQAKADLQAGKEVIVPAIGKFVDVEGKTTFITDPKLHYATPAIPVVRLNKREEATAPSSAKQAPTPAYQPSAATASPAYQPPPYEEETGRRLNWGRIILVAAILLVFVAVNIIGYNYIKHRKATPPPAVVENPAPVKDTTPLPQTIMPITADTSAKVDTAAPPVMLPESNIAVKNNFLYYKVILNTYYSKEKAEKRYKQLRGNGTKVDMMTEDSLNYYIVLPIRSTSKDTTRILDSLSTLYNPNGVSIY